MRLRNTILEAAGYDKSQMDSFIICDEDWGKEKEITYYDMDSDSDEDIWLMEDTPLDELLDDEGQKLKFVFDYLSDRYFYMILKETVPGKNLHDPLCQRIEEMEEFYGDEEFNEEELAELNDEFREEQGGGDDL